MDKPEVFNKTSTVGFMSLLVLPKMANMYFTCIILNGKAKDNRRVILLKLYKATNENGKWVNVQEITF
jgi:hypothetical protein